MQSDLKAEHTDIDIIRKSFLVLIFCGKGITGSLNMVVQPYLFDTEFWTVELIKWQGRVRWSGWRWQNGWFGTRRARSHEYLEAIHGPEVPSGCQVVTMERVAGAVHLMVRRRRVGGKGQQCGYWFKIYKKGFSMR